MAQLEESELSRQGPAGGNSIAVVACHVTGNLTSRFTDFLVADGEKSWCNREEEFAFRTPTRQELMTHWEKGWKVLFESLAELTDRHL